jgi:hypothetical protein
MTTTFQYESDPEASRPVKIAEPCEEIVPDADFFLVNKDAESYLARSQADWLNTGTSEHKDTSTTSVELQKKETKMAPLYRIRDKSIIPRHLLILQQWEGVIEQVLSESIVAVLSDLTEASGHQEIVEIPTEEINPSDRDLLEPGAVFYWAIKYEDTPGGQRRRISEIRMRRMPKWSKSMVADVEEEAATMYQQLCENTGDASA